MRVSLAPGGQDFAEQVQALRRGLSAIDMRGDPQQAMSARMAISVFVPFLSALRTELMASEVTPTMIARAAADLLANIAATTLASMIDAPVDVITAETENLLFAAKEIAAHSIAEENAAEQQATRAKLGLIMGGKPEGPTSVIHDRRALVAEEDCPGHVASPGNPKVCGRCGVHIDSFRPDEDDERIARET